MQRETLVSASPRGILLAVTDDPTKQGPAQADGQEVDPTPAPDETAPTEARLRIDPKELQVPWVGGQRAGGAAPGDARAASPESPPYAQGTPEALPRVATWVAYAIGGLSAVVSLASVLFSVALPGGLRGDVSTLSFGIGLLVCGALITAGYRQGMYAAAILCALSLAEIVVARAVGQAPTGLLGALVRGALSLMFWRAAGKMPKRRPRSRAVWALAVIVAIAPAAISAVSLRAAIRAEGIARAAVSALQDGNEIKAEDGFRKALEVWPAHAGARLALAAVLGRRCASATAGTGTYACGEVVRILDEGDRLIPGFLESHPQAAKLRNLAAARSTGAVPATTAPTALPPATGAATATPEP